MLEKKIKVLHGYGFPNLVLYQKDTETLTVRDEVDGEIKTIEASVNLLPMVGISRVNCCLIASEQDK